MNFQVHPKEKTYFSILEKRGEMKRYLGLLLLLFCGFLRAGWVAKTVKKMTLREKIGQLFFVAVRSNPDAEDDFFEYIRKALDLTAEHDREYAQTMIDEYKVGGILLISRGDVVEQHTFTRDLQKRSSIPLIFLQDNEWMLGLLRNTMRFPMPLTLGAIQDNQLLYELGKELARQCRLIDVHSTLSPVVDVNNNRANPVIGRRSYGENKKRVTQKVCAFCRGLQEGGVHACAKHFPGHGDTSIDSHFMLPVVPHCIPRLEEIELYPYRELIELAIPMIMTAHLEVPALEPYGGPVSLSPKVVTQLLRKKMKYKGLIITDALSMHGVSDGRDDADVALAALKAGHDILLYVKDVPRAIKKIEEAVVRGEITEKEIDKHVTRILQAKEQLKLHKKNHAKSVVTMEQLHTPEAAELKKKLFSQAITMVKNDNAFPLQETGTVAVVCIGDSHGDAFAKRLTEQRADLAGQKIDTYHLAMNCSEEEADTLRKKMAKYDTVIYALYSMNYNDKNYGISRQAWQFIQACNKNQPANYRERLIRKIITYPELRKTIVVLFASPYALEFFSDENGIVVGYEDDPDAQEAAADVVIGKCNPLGTLPVTGSKEFKEGLGLHYN